MPAVRVQYFAVLREQRGLSEETLETSAHTAGELYEQLKTQHALSLPLSALRCAVNDEFAEMDRVLSDGDAIVFLSPVAGG